VPTNEEKNMKALIKQMAPEVWTSVIFPTGSTGGRTPYPTVDAAVEAAEAQHPGVEILVEE
jgi:hypothetical protein